MSVDPLAEQLAALPPEGPPVPWIRQLRVVARGLLPSTKRRPFLIYAQGRTGSTLLGGLLGSHPQVAFGNEVLRGPVHLPTRYVEGLRAGAGDVSYGIHVKPYHLTNSQGVKDNRPWLEQMAGRGWLLVHLRREDTLRHVLSNYSRNANATSHFFEGDGRRTAKLRIDPQELMQVMEARVRVAEQEHADLAGLQHVEVSYERDLLPGPTAWGSTTARVFAELGLPPCPVSTSLRKINQGSLEDLLDNADEVVAALRGTRWGSLVE